MKKRAIFPFIFASFYLLAGAGVLYYFFTSVSFAEIYHASCTLFAPVSMLLSALMLLLLGSYYLRKVFLRQKKRQHIRFL